MKIIPVKYADSVLPESAIFQNGDNDKYRPIKFIVYLIKTDNRLILIDAGCETMPGFDMKNFIGPVKALENIGISTDDITDVIITHAHHDHIECIKYFKNATVYIQEDEYEQGKNYIPEQFNVCTFCEECTVADAVKAIKSGGHTKGSSVVEVLCDGKVYAIVGDECYLRECLEERIPTGSSRCKEKSRAFIEKYSSGQYIVLLAHE